MNAPTDHLGATHIEMLDGFGLTGSRQRDFRQFQIGYGKSFASFGELVQGRTGLGDDFLVTMPVDLWSTCELICTKIRGPLIVECDLEKSKSAIHFVLSELGIQSGYHILVRFSRNIPVGKGLSSSTADMLAALRALQEVFGFVYHETSLSQIFHAIEPHDALFYNSCVIYNHRSGELLRDLRYIPAFKLLAVDSGGVLDTVRYNRTLEFTQSQMQCYDRLLASLTSAFSARDDAAIAACATRSSRLHVERTGNQLVARALEDAEDLGALGVIATHSGTCAAFLFSSDTSDCRIAEIAKGISYGRSANIFFTRTLEVLECRNL